MKVIKIKFQLFIILNLVFGYAHSHGGRTDSKGCHHNRKVGDYHCHNSTTKYTMLVKKKQLKFTCGNKRLCTDMISCNEAKFYLKNCGLKRLDKDRDGIPCESICGGKSR